MISESENDQNNEEKTMPEVCATCNFWQVFMVRPQDHQGIGACGNQVNVSAPFGVLMAGYGSCECWEQDQRPKPKIVKAPAGLNNKLNRRIISG